MSGRIRAGDSGELLPVLEIPPDNWSWDPTNYPNLLKNLNVHLPQPRIGYKWNISQLTYRISQVPEQPYIPLLVESYPFTVNTIVNGNVIDSGLLLFTGFNDDTDIVYRVSITSELIIVPGDNWLVNFRPTVLQWTGTTEQPVLRVKAFIDGTNERDE